MKEIVENVTEFFTIWKLLNLTVLTEAQMFSFTNASVAFVL
jgi:hypothetical protein